MFTTKRSKIAMRCFGKTKIWIHLRAKPPSFCSSKFETEADQPLISFWSWLTLWFLLPYLVFSLMNVREKIRIDQCLLKKPSKAFHKLVKSASEEGLAFFCTSGRRYANNFTAKIKLIDARSVFSDRFACVKSLHSMGSENASRWNGWSTETDISSTIMSTLYA